MTIQVISLADWTLVDQSGRTKFGNNPETYGELRMVGINNHSAYLQKTILIPKSTDMKLTAKAHRSQPALSDVQVGLKNSQHTKWGHWTGRKSELTSPECSMSEHEGLLNLMLRFAGEWGTHSCEFFDIQLTYDLTEGQEPPPPDDGIAGQLARVCAKINGALEEIKIHLQEIDTLFAEKQKAQDWVDTYNRSIKDE